MPLSRIRSNVAPHAVEGDDPDRYINEEYPAPAVTVGEPAAQGGTEDWSDHDAHSPHGHGLALLLAGIDLHENDLRERHESCAEDPLQQTRGDDFRERIRH